MKVVSIDPGFVHFSFCIIDSKGIIHEWQNLDLGNNPVENLITELDNFPMIFECDVVLIENQPKLNPKMQKFAGQIYMLFAIRKIDLKKKYKIIYYNPKNKLKKYAGLIPDFLHIKQLQRRNKEKARYILSKLIEYQDYDLIVYYFSNVKSRKDDLADSYLQALSYL
jgi:hypothetical protein